MPEWQTNQDSYKNHKLAIEQIVGAASSNCRAKNEISNGCNSFRYERSEKWMCQVHYNMPLLLLLLFLCHWRESNHTPAFDIPSFPWSVTRIILLGLEIPLPSLQPFYRLFLSFLWLSLKQNLISLHGNSPH